MSITVTTGMLPAAISESLSDKPSQMYIYMEYVNDVSSIPVAFTSAQNIYAVESHFNSPSSYYLDFQSGLNFNYIRVPAIRSPIVEHVKTNNSSEAITLYLAQSTPGIIGVKANGPSFGTNSICYGAALVLVPDINDVTKDLIMARSYFTAASERLTKSAASELFITFPLKINSTKAT